MTRTRLSVCDENSMMSLVLSLVIDMRLNYFSSDLVLNKVIFVCNRNDYLPLT